MIREWHDQPSASALESAGPWVSRLLLREGKGFRVSMTKKVSSNPGADSLHMSAQAPLILLALMGWGWGVCGMHVMKHRGGSLCVFTRAALQRLVLYKCWAMKRWLGKFKTLTVHRHSFCPLSPVLCLFIAKSQTSLLHAFFIFIFLLFFFHSDSRSHSVFPWEFTPCLCSWLLLC